MTSTLGIVDASLDPNHPHANNLGWFASRKIAGQPLLSWLVRRASESLQLSEVLVLADSGFAEAMERLVPPGVQTVASTEKDALARFAIAAEPFSGEAVVRIRLDCPLVDPELIDAMCVSAAENALDYATYCSRSEGQVALGRMGLFAEWCSRKALLNADRAATHPSERSSPMTYIVSHPETFDLRFLAPPQRLNDSELRLQIHADRDWDNAQLIVDALGAEHLDWPHLADLLETHADLHEAMVQLNKEASLTSKGPTRSL